MANPSNRIESYFRYQIMAERRMFTKKITLSDDFLSMPHSSQNLYFHLNMEADDEGFVNSVKRIMRMVNANEDDLKILIAKRFVLVFESGVIVIKHWKLHNKIRRDRLKNTSHQDEKALIIEKEDGVYTESDNHLTTMWQPDDNQVTTKCPHRLGEDRLGEVRLVEGSKADDTPPPIKTKRFKKPSINDLESYITEKGYVVDAESFFNYYESNGWKVGRNPMKSWQSALASWNARDKKTNRNIAVPRYMEEKPNVSTESEEERQKLLSKLKKG